MNKEIKEKIIEIIDEGRRYRHHPSKDADLILQALETQDNYYKSLFKVKKEQQVLDEIKEFEIKNHPDPIVALLGTTKLIKNWQRRLKNS